MNGSETKNMSLSKYKLVLAPKCDQTVAVTWNVPQQTLKVGFLSSVFFHIKVR